MKPRFPESGVEGEVLLHYLMMRVDAKVCLSGFGEGEIQPPAARRAKRRHGHYSNYSDQVVSLHRGGKRRVWKPVRPGTRAEKKKKERINCQLRERESNR